MRGPEFAAKLPPPLAGPVGAAGLQPTLPIRLSAVYELEGPGRDGVTKAFEKPWCMTTGEWGVECCVLLTEGLSLSLPTGSHACAPSFTFVAMPSPNPCPAVMFCGMSFCLPLAFFVERKQRQRAEKAAAAAGSTQEPLLPEGVSPTLPGAHAQILVVKSIITSAAPFAKAILKSTADRPCRSP